MLTKFNKWLNNQLDKQNQDNISSNDAGEIIINLTNFFLLQDVPAEFAKYNKVTKSYQLLDEITAYFDKHCIKPTYIRARPSKPSLLILQLKVDELV